MEAENNPKKTSTKEKPEKGTAEKLPDGPSYDKERAQFRALILANPNYFGNIKVSPFPPVLNIQSNTFYEEIGCVGFQPQFNRLEAVVYVNQPFGYGGDICSAGTQEYVRFFISFDNGVTWQDQGLTSFTAYDIPEGTTGAKRLEYGVTLQINPPKKFCLFNNLALVRAILSWNQPPPPDPNFNPVWGNVHDTHIQIEGFDLFPFEDLFQVLKIKTPPQLSELVDLTQPVAAAKPKALNVAELQALYKDKGVEPHRFALSELHKLISQPALSESLMAPGFKGLFEGLNINLIDIIGKLFPVDGNTNYEELECIGLNPNQDTLAGVIRVKLPNGYSGGPCTDGSREYVTFWGDFNNNGTFETCLGTASVSVYDINKIPKEGLEYAVFLPVDLNKYRQPCEDGPRVVRIRAILSWNVAPPCNNPNYIPVWGNREETLIHIYPGKKIQPGDFTPFLYEISGVGVCSIDQATGFATGDRPFGKIINITGEIPAALALTMPDTLKYKVSVRELPGGAPQALNNSFDVFIIEGIGSGPATGSSLSQVADSSGPYINFYTYREYGTPVSGAWRRVASPNRLLAQWNTGQPMTGMWEIMVEAVDTLTNTPYAAGVTTCIADGTTRQNVKIKLDEVAPVGNIAIIGFSVGSGPIQPAVDCATFTKGVTIHGTYSATDEHFGSLSLTVEPAGPANGATVNPSSRTYYLPDLVPTTGEAGTWTLDTSPMDPCGYVIRLQVSDRTIVSGDGPWQDEDFVGFCLEVPQP